MAEEGDDVTDLTKSLKQLLTSFTPYIREAGSAEQTEQAILHLEESDENFHRYEFVKQLRMQIEGALGPLIDDEIEKYSIAGSERAAGQETVVSKIIDKILNANEYQGNVFIILIKLVILILIVSADLSDETHIIISPNKVT